MRLLEHLRDQNSLWELLLKAQNQGWIFLDESNDSITTTHRLLLQQPDLHKFISQITNDKKQIINISTELSDLLRKSLLAENE